MVFKKIRELWNVDPKAYMFSLGPEKILGNLLLGNLSALCEVVSTGRSGSLFFKANDGKYLLKTIPPQEELLARSLLPAYHAHASKYPNMLMTRFLGLHTMARGPAGRQADLRFVVMTNVFDTPLKIHEQYDLKGSTVGRHVEAPSLDDEEEADAEVALKDLDFKRRIYLGPENKAILLEQVEQDCKFMEHHNICDYSFLIGVHRIDHKSPLYNFAEISSVPPSPKPLSQKNRFQEKTSVFQRDYGGILSFDRKEVYFIGIIDTLTTWELGKKFEKTLKSIFHDSSQISAIAPTPYRARFQKYISSIVD
jgi:1-phosphatidylinositol-4-phosphate 5-kinase